MDRGIVTSSFYRISRPTECERFCAVGESPRRPMPDIHGPASNKAELNRTGQRVTLLHVVVHLDSRRKMCSNLSARLK